MDGNTLRFLIFVSVFLLMLILEWFNSRHPTVDSKPRRLGIHLGLSGLNTLLLKLVFGAAAVGAAETFEVRGWGLLNILDVVALINIVLSNSNPAETSDLNEDGQINILDVVVLINIILAL